VGGGPKEGWADSGYIEVFSQFGWIGGIAFFTAMAKIWSELSKRIQQGGRDPFLFTGRAVLLGCLVFLYVGNVFGGFSLFWVFLGISINRMTRPVPSPVLVAHPLMQLPLDPQLGPATGATFPFNPNSRLA
jgi:hypothetical protein